MLVYVTLNSVTMLLGFPQETETEVSVILLNIRSVGGSGPGKKKMVGGEMSYRI